MGSRFEDLRFGSLVDPRDEGRQVVEEEDDPSTKRVSGIERRLRVATNLVGSQSRWRGPFR